MNVCNHYRKFLTYNWLIIDTSSWLINDTIATEVTTSRKKLLITSIQISDIWSHDCIFVAQQLAHIYGHLQCPGITWSQCMAVLAETSISFKFPLKKTCPKRTMGSLNGIHLITAAKKIVKSIMVTWWAALQPSQHTTRIVGSITVISQVQPVSSMHSQVTGDRMDDEKISFWAPHNHSRWSLMKISLRSKCPSLIATCAYETESMSPLQVDLVRVFIIPGMLESNPEDYELSPPVSHVQQQQISRKDWAKTKRKGTQCYWPMLKEVD